MKKLCLIAFLAIFSLASVHAQDVTLGAKAGVNFASLNGDGADGIDGRTSFHVGAMAEIPVSDVFSVQPELVYSDQGAEAGSTKLKLGYLNLPIMAKYYVAEGFNLQAGPQIGFLMSSKAESGGSSADLKDETKGIDFGLGLGAGYKLDNGLNFSARYVVGLSDIDDTNDPDDFKNGVFQLSIGYFFN